MSQPPYQAPSGPGPQFTGPFGPGTGQSSFGGWGGSVQPQWPAQGQPVGPYRPQGPYAPQVPQGAPGAYSAVPGQYATPGPYAQPQQAPYGQAQYGQAQYGQAPQYRPTTQYGPTMQYGPQGYNQGPGQFGTPPTPRSKAPTALLIALGGAGLVLVLLLVYALVGRGSGPTGPQNPYQNENFQVPSVKEPPPLPIPTTQQELESWLVSNAIYGTTIASPVRCELQLSDDSLTVGNAELEKRLTTFVGCLTRVWGPTLEQANFVPYQPSITVYPANSKAQTPCGVMSPYNAFFCGGDQQLYVADNVLQILSPDIASKRAVYEFIVAHEYGHAMQGRTGLFASAAILESNVAEADQPGLSRRSELQADCFAGLSLRSLSQSLGVTADEETGLPRIAADTGDDALANRFGGDPTALGDHGQSVNREMWSSRGLGSDQVGVCNTWTAPDDETR